MGLKVKDIRKGEIFHESGYGRSIAFVAMSDPVAGDGLEGRPQHVLRSRAIGDGVEVVHMATEGLEHYGPRLSREAAYRGALLPVDLPAIDPDILMAYAEADRNVSLRDFILEQEDRPVMF